MLFVLKILHMVELARPIVIWTNEMYARLLVSWSGGCLSWAFHCILSTQILRDHNRLANKVMCTTFFTQTKRSHNGLSMIMKLWDSTDSTHVNTHWLVIGTLMDTAVSGWVWPMVLTAWHRMDEIGIGITGRLSEALIDLTRVGPDAWSKAMILCPSQTGRHMYWNFNCSIETVQ